MHTSIPGYDHTTDANPVALTWAASQIPLPDYCKQAADQEKMATYSAGAFADPEARLFPICDPGNTLLSGIYCLGLPESVKASATLASVERAVAAWNITEDWGKYAALFQDAKQATFSEEEVKFAMVVTYPEAPTEYYYPIDDLVSLEKSAKALVSDAHEGRLPAGWVRKAAQAMTAAADKMQAELPDFVKRAGTTCTPDYDRANFLLFSRKPLCSESNFTLYEDLVKAAAAEPERIEEFIAHMEDLDLALGVKYARSSVSGPSVPLPHELFYSGMTADEFEKFALSQIVIASVAVPQQIVGAVKEAAVRQHWPKATAELVLPAVKAAASNDNSSEACSIVESWDGGLQQDFLKFLLARS